MHISISIGDKATDTAIQAQGELIAQVISDAIRDVGTKDCFDIISVVLPLVLSLVAIVVTLYTVYKQNKIALFQLRYDAFFTIFLVLQFSESVKKLKNAKYAVVLYNSYFSSSLPFDDPAEALQLVYASNKKLERMSFASKFLFKTPKAHALIAQIFKSLNDFMAGAVEGRIDEKSRDELNRSCEEFYSNHKKRFEKYLFLYWRELNER